MSDEEENNRLTPEYLKAFERGFSAGLFYQRCRYKFRSLGRASSELNGKLYAEQAKYALNIDDEHNASAVVTKLNLVIRDAKRLNELELKEDEAKSKKKKV